MTPRTAVAAAVLLLAACSSNNSGGAPARGPAARPSAGGMRDTAQLSMEARGPGRAPPTFGLIGQRERLGLSSQQVTSIDSIGEALRVKNEALLRHLRALQDSLGGRDRISTRAERELLERGAPQFAAMRTNNLEATRAVYDVLTPQQRTATCTMLREVSGTDPNGLGRGQVRGRGMGSGRGAYGDGSNDRRRMGADTLRYRRQTAMYWCPADTTKPVVRP
jgi:Spy/CpxP family protein refolding chaperone